MLSDWHEHEAPNVMEQSTLISPLWPAQLDHLCLTSPEPEALAAFHARALGYERFACSNGDVLLQAPGRRLLVREGAAGGRDWHAYRLAERRQVEALAGHLQGLGLALEDSPCPLFEEGAVAVRDPDGWLVIFGMPRSDLPSQKAPPRFSAAALPARLQHVVVASADLEPMMRFYHDTLGFAASDYCLADVSDPASRRVAFFRSDPEHHSFAVFGAPKVRADHHAYETSCWNDIRDWADHLAAQQIPIWWGPGRHGPGNNLFFMIRDPDEQAVEFSAELERMPREMAPREWPLDQRSLNLWGSAWMRE